MFFLKDATRSSEVVEEENNWYGFMFVGDNIDKNVNPRFQRCENRGQSLHYFHGYVLRDRVDLISTLSDVALPFQKTDLSTFLPSKEDISSLNDELTVLLSRYVKSYAIVDPLFSCENEISGIVSRIINSSKY